MLGAYTCCPFRRELGLVRFLRFQALGQSDRPRRQLRTDLVPPNHSLGVLKGANAIVALRCCVLGNAHEGFWTQ